MGKDVLLTHSFESAKNFLSTEYHSLKHVLKEYLVRRDNDREINTHDIKLETGGLIYTFVLLNAFHLIIALLLIAAGVAVELAYLCYSLTFEFNLISMSWSIIGVALLCCSIVGIIASCKKSVSLTHIYIILMTITFVAHLQIAVVGFTLISTSEFVAKHTLYRFMDSYGLFQPSTIAMDLIQKKLQCCGVDLPYDWCAQRKCEFENNSFHKVGKMTNGPPESCYKLPYDYRIVQDDYFQKGCLGEVSEIILETLTIQYYVSWTIVFSEIIGIVFAFAVAIKSPNKLLRENLYHDTRWLHSDDDDHTTNQE